MEAKTDRRSGRRVLAWLGGIAGVAVVGIAGLGTWSAWSLNASLPQLEGTAAIPGLSAPVTVERDENGVPTLTGPDRTSLMYALGFLHAQERYFQMDLMRRSAAGELSELVGPAMAKEDTPRRLHRFRARAHAAVERSGPEERAMLTAYTAGVNAGLNGLKRAPFEYTLLRQQPKPWSLEDTLLVVDAMYFDLQSSDGWEERRLALAIDQMGPAMANFLYPQGTELDAPLDGSTLPEPPMPDSYTPAVKMGAVAPEQGEGEAMIPGSNNWAVSGALTSTGAAMVANDMHLRLWAPNTWYRARLVVKPAGADAPTLDLIGVTLPGNPLLVVGSNKRIAWGYTDAYVDTGDVVVLEPVDGDADRYKTPDGPKTLEKHREVLCPAPTCPSITVEDSDWGPVVGTDAQGRKLAYRWVAHDVGAEVMSAGAALERAGSVDEAVAIAHRLPIPNENMMVVDAKGNLAWTIVGLVPRRFGHDGTLPVSWADGKAGWNGYLSPAEVPVIANPANGRLWTANTRVVGGDALAKLGFGGYALGGRAGQIRDDLAARDHFAEKDMLDIQLDDRAPMLDFWQRLMLQALGERASDQALANLVAPVESWGGRAAIPSVGYRLVRSFRTAVVDRLYQAYTAPLAGPAGDHAGDLVSHQAEGPARRLLTAKSPGLVPPGYKSWDALIDAALKDVRERLAQNGGDIARFTWGDRNRLAIHHPLSTVAPVLAPYLDPPSEPVAGDLFQPRVTAPSFGASERLVVSPGHEDTGLFHMPTGQSGHPLSPYYNKGHEDWVQGRATPLLPGATRWRLTLAPAPASATP
ncbi:penicillin acylase family protein [Nitrospirillum sp. BR 11828]|uniref:penicillin acylase family protein n=1 Tax=Nitrospirillum sp. BR 11828 TaxID=3104325 RepID=UPI002ACABFCE|nr:penicillin acylase family protein [Nitrospirillum sp. BR 11828]MDZ5646749.1 penicillin acylase family protein [Nitrospirillum sp. BR 11828]